MFETQIDVLSCSGILQIEMTGNQLDQQQEIWFVLLDKRLTKPHITTSQVLMFLISFV